MLLWACLSMPSHTQCSNASRFRRPMPANLIFIISTATPAPAASCSWSAMTQFQVTERKCSLYLRSNIYIWSLLRINLMLHAPVGDFVIMYVSTWSLLCTSLVLVYELHSALDWVLVCYVHYMCTSLWILSKVDIITTLSLTIFRFFAQYLGWA